MLQLFTSGLISLWMQTAEVQSFPSQTAYVYGVKDALRVTLSNQPDAPTAAMVEQYLKQLATKGLSKTGQGVWLQSGTALLANHQGTKPLPAASITKVATSLVALDTWKPDHRFATVVRATGPVKNGVLQGDLVIQGGGDPFFVWEEAIALGNALNQIGIRKVSGNLIITGNFAMNFATDPKTTGQLLRQALDVSLWSGEIEAMYANLPKGTPKPKVEIGGSIAVPTAAGRTLLQRATPIIRRFSLPLADILKSMNIYSNNAMAEMLAKQLGGGKVVAQRAAAIAGVPTNEIQLINGSGLGPENRISPRAACALFIAIQQHLKPNYLAVSDLFPVAGQDKGTVLDRGIPKGTVVKTGTLWDVSALAGVLPTRDRGLIWFAIMNRGDYVDGFRTQQDKLLQALARQWGTPASMPEAIAPQVLPTLRFADFDTSHPALGQASRNQLLVQPGG